MLLVEYLAQWLESIKPMLRPVTYEAYTVYINRHMIPYFTPYAYSLETITPMQIQQYVGTKLQGGRLDGHKGGLSVVSVRKHLNILRQSLDDAIRYGYIQSNPAKFVRLPRNRGTLSKRCVFLSSDEALKVLESLEKYHEIHLAVMLALFYGLRRSEVLGLQWKDIDFRNNSISICHTVVKGLTIHECNETKTLGSTAVYQLMPEVKKALTLQRLETKKHKSIYVFSRVDGTVMRPDCLTRTFQRCLKRHGFEKMRFHDLRHSTASILFDRGWSLEDVKQWLRHSDIETTSNIYTHYNNSRKMLIAKDISEIFSK